MAFFLMWMVAFFVMAISWKYMGFSWSFWRNQNYLQVQREPSKRLCNVIPSLEEYLKDIKASPTKKVLNKNQCVHLLDKFIVAMKEIDKMLSNTNEDLKFQSIFEELCYLQKKVEIVRKNCIEQKQWCHSAVFQLHNKEIFRELLLDLKCCYDTAKDVFLFHQPNQSNNMLPIEFDAATYEEVFEDRQELEEKLELVLQGEISEDYDIAQHLLLRVRNLDRVDGGDLDALGFSNDFKKPKLIERIGNYGDVYKANWLGLPCATKVLQGDSEYLKYSCKEAGILTSLNHPNLVQFFGCGIIKGIDEDHEESGVMHLVMELMDSSLSTILNKARSPIPYVVVVDIMHQIAKGVYYLHDMQVAHLDLKPDNVLCSSIPMEDLDPCRIFKITDYAVSQLEVCSNPRYPEPSNYTIGTRGYMAPEMIKNSNTPRYPFQADVWSFAMICSQILSGKVPYCDLRSKEFYDQMKGTHGHNLRPSLPNNCEELTNLIQECWSQDPLQRPTFSEICKRLTSLKKSFLKGIYSYKMVPQFDSLCTLRDSKSIANHVQKVYKSIIPPKEIPIDVDHQLLKAKELLKMNYVGIVGMGGIGKTTLAKAIFDDATVKSSYHASCFVANCKNYQSSYEILCKILSKLGNDQKPKNLGDAQEMMKELFLINKILLVLDDVNREALLHDIVPLNIVQASKGTTIIITTRQWSTIESFVGIEGRLDVQLLDEEAATTLFTSHLCWGVAPLSSDFEDLRKYVVKACNGLPLSLKVMGTFLHSKERLRSWERALQKMARGRNLGDDEIIHDTIHISFDELDNDIQKRMFLDVACFFCRDVYPSGISKAMILSLWAKDGILPIDELERLIDMSLLKANGDGDILEMHDLVRDMGRMIAKGTRIWKASMLPESGFSNKDAEVLEGISLQGTINHRVPLLKQGPSFDFEKLRVLILGSTLGNIKEYIANLNCLFEIATHCSQLEAIIIGNSQTLIGLPPTLQTDIVATFNFKIFDLCGTCASLKILDLIGFGFLEKFPTKFASSNTLLRLNLSSCISLVALPNEIGNLSSLITLDLSWCSSLEALPKEVGSLSSLTTFILCGCSRLEALPKEVGCLSSLTTLNLNWCSSLVTLPIEVGDLSSLTTLHLKWCSSLAILPNEVGNLSSLTSLNLWRCSRLTTLPKEVGKLPCLTYFDLSWCSKLEALPNEVGNLSFLTSFNLLGCSRLVALPKEIGSLSSLTSFTLKECSILMALPKEIGDLSSLTTLNLRKCSSLVTLPKEVGNLSYLTTLNLSECSSLVTLPKEVGSLSSLTTLNLSECSSLVTLPMEVGNLSSLITLDLYGCSNLAALPEELENLSSLTIFHFKVKNS